MIIDAEHYEILARTGHHAERHEVARDDAIGLEAARRAARRLRVRHYGADVEIFLCKGHSRILAQ